MDIRPPRKSHSPTRQRLSALSPLQAFSPLVSEGGRATSPNPGRSRGHSRSSSVSSTTSAVSALSSSASGLTPGSLRRSLSSRERVFRRDSNGNGNREDYPTGVTTRLILVKAPPEAQQQPSQAIQDSPPLRQRSKSSSNLPPIAAAAAAPAPPGSDIPATSARSPRRSFAAASFSSFAGALSPMSPLNQNNGDRGGAASSAPNSSIIARRPSSGALSISTGSSPGNSKILSPDEVLNYARGLMSPVVASGDSFSGASGAALSRSKSVSVGSLQRSKSTGGFSSLSRSNSMASTILQPEGEPVEPIELEPIDYVPLDEDTLLPFSDRPSQVNELLHNPVNADMLSLLKQAFPKGEARKDWKAIDVTKWNWDEFLLHLTKIDRDECPDYEWVLLARTAVRAHSVAVWEKLGACLGCDSELITAGDEDETPASWGGLGLGDEGEYDPTQARVHIEAIEAIDPEDFEEQEAALSRGFDEPLENDAMSLWSSSYGMDQVDTMDTIREKEEPASNGGSGSGASSLGLEPSRGVSPMTSVSSLPKIDPKVDAVSRQREVTASPMDYTNQHSFARNSRDSRTSLTSDDSSTPNSPDPSRASPRTLPGSRSQSQPRSKSRDGKRSKSFVGLQIMTVTPDLGPMSSPKAGSMGFGLGSPPGIGMMAPQYERTPGNPLFVSSFNTLSLAPNLGRRASTGIAGGMRGSAPCVEQMRRQRPIVRKLSGTGMSESAITFVSDSSGVEAAH